MRMIFHVTEKFVPRVLSRNVYFYSFRPKVQGQPKNQMNPPPLIQKTRGFPQGVLIGTHSLSYLIHPAF